MIDSNPSPRFQVKNLQGRVFGEHEQLVDAVRDARDKVFALHVVDRETGCAVHLEEAS